MRRPLLIVGLAGVLAAAAGQPARADAVLSTTTTVIDFGGVDRNSTASRTIAVSNTGDAAGKITGLSLNNDRFAAGRTGSGGARILVPKGGVINIDVTFTPVENGEQNGLLTIVHDAGKPIPVPLVGTGAPIEISPRHVTFGDVRPDMPATRSITVRSLGTAAFQLSSAKLDNAQDFAIRNFVEGTEVSSGEETHFDVDARPSQLGARRGAITLETSVGTFTIDLNAVGVTPELTLETEDGTPGDGIFDFGAHDIDADAATGVIKIHNRGGAALVISSCTFLGSSTITIVANTCPLTIAPGTVASLALTFDPAAQATARTLLTLQTNLPAALAKIPIQVIGAGVDQAMSLPATRLDFANAYRNPRTPTMASLAVENFGSGPLTLTMLVTTSDSFVVAGAPTVVVPAGGTAGVPVEFRPRMLGELDGTLTFTSDEMSRAPSIELKGKGVPRGVTVGGPRLDLGQTYEGVAVRLSEVAGETITLENTDRIPFEITAVTVVGSDAFRAIVPDDRQLVLDQPRTIDIEFVPGRRGDYEATLQIYLDDDPVPHAELKLVGHGLDGRGTYYTSCATGRGAGPLLLVGVALWIAGRRRR